MCGWYNQNSSQMKYSCLGWQLQWLKVHVIMGGRKSRRALPATKPGSGSAGQSSKGQKVKMGGGFSFPEAGNHQSICQAVSATVRSPGLSVTLWRKGVSLQHQPHLRDGGGERTA